ncbi:MAG: diguanylate cyclase [Lachnospiraceae bacterium]|nr:diguanylate cyclase [Lachnospiraceae bacterium]
MSETKKRRRIQVGLLVGHLQDEFDAAVCAGAMEAAAEKDVNLVIIPGRYINGVYKDVVNTAYEYQYHTLFDVPLRVKFDVLLVLIGTIGGHLSKEEQAELLGRYQGTPIITIASEIEGYPCINIDNNTGMGDVIRHLIEAHGCKKIGYVSGPLTNDDAKARLDVYRRVLEEHGIEYDPDRVVYGNFSRYVTNAVQALLDKNSDLDAIAFANDQMAYTGYKVLEQRGIRPGRDICVTGFDDDPVCMELTPHLTTVKADSRELGYQALVEAVNLTLEGEIEQSVMASHLVVRDSCGCTEHNAEELELRKLVDEEPENIAQYLGDYLFGTDHFDVHVKEMCIRSFCSLDAKSLDEMFNSDAQEVNVVMRAILIWIREGRISGSRFFIILDILQNRCIRRAESKDDIERINMLFSAFFRAVAEVNDQICNQKIEENNQITIKTNAITRDMIVFEATDDRAYYTVVEKMNKLGIRSSYLFAYENVIEHPADKQWRYPDSLLLKAYSDELQSYQVTGEAQRIPFGELFTNSFIQDDRRHTLVMSVLFTREEQFGLLLAEAGAEQFGTIQAVNLQLCAALKIISLIKRQDMIERQLRSSLIEVRENNQLLGELSKTDELTGVYNRRGLYEGMRKCMNDPANADKRAFMIFADLDSLKIINDRFGHEEGDFAIKSAANILRSALGEDAVIGRLGGDEFASCIFTDTSMTVKRMKELLEKMMLRFNDNCGADKPYIVHLSVGVYAFKNTEEVEIGELLSHADMLLYEQKRNKKSILKE